MRRASASCPFLPHLYLPADLKFWFFCLYHEKTGTLRMPALKTRDNAGARFFQLSDNTLLSSRRTSMVWRVTPVLQKIERRWVRAVLRRTPMVSAASSSV